MKRNTLTSSFLASYRTHYNQLGDVDETYEQFKRRKDRLKIIRGALRKIRDGGANDYLGLFLLHRHFECKRGIVFIEREHTPKHKEHRALFVTTAERAADAPARLAPYRFTVERNGNLQPLEFTTDAKAISAYRKLAGAKDLCAELGSYLHENGMSSFLGLGIHARDRALDHTTEVFVEDTSFEELMSITHLVHRGIIRGRSIPTLWTSVAGTSNGCCTYECSAYCVHQGATGYCGHKKTNHIGCV